MRRHFYSIAMVFMLLFGASTLISACVFRAGPAAHGHAPRGQAHGQKHRGRGHGKHNNPGQHRGQSKHQGRGKHRGRH